MGIKVRVKRRKLYLDIYHGGKRIWESLGLTVSDDPAVNRENMRLAEYARAKREQQIFSGQWGLQDRIGAKKPLYSYLKGMAQGRNKQKDRVCKVLPWLEKYSGGKEIQIGQVTGKWFTSFQNYLIKDTGLSEQSANSYAFAIRMALRQAVRENILLSDPSEGVKSIAVPEPDREYLELAELQHLSRVEIGGKLGAEVKRAFVFACYCALRISDLKSLRWNDVEHTTSGAQIVKRQVKTRTRVVVPLHDSAWALINDGALHNHGEYVFPLLAGSRTDTNKYLIQWAEKAGIQKHITWHAARRTCPSLLHEMGVDIYTIQKICGHSRIETTGIYTKVSDGKLREAVNALPAIESK
ncbi:MAG: tyrosine-type recombinase/integrase [Treponema sp.]|nr:tyrosine-type recombinase/integrase [Treponema sp.]